MSVGLFRSTVTTGAMLVTLSVAHAETEVADADQVVARVDWLQEVLRGGATSVALVVLVMVAVAIVIERLMRVRSRLFVPAQLVATIDQLAAGTGGKALGQTIREDRSVLGRALQAFVERSPEPDGARRDAAEDILRRAVRGESARTSLLAVVAGLAPLLGLLGTMIGMIEAFKLVELYGDEGGASMLAGSISKALITTALGLVIAIMSLVAYHGIRFRTAALAARVEDQLDRFERIMARRTGKPQVATHGEPSDGHLAS